MLEPCSEFDDLDAIQGAQSADTTNPHKSSASIMTKYYEQLTSRRKTLIFVGFDAKVHQKVQGFLKGKH